MRNLGQLQIHISHSTCALGEVVLDPRKWSWATPRVWSWVIPRVWSWATRGVWSWATPRVWSWATYPREKGSWWLTSAGEVFLPLALPCESTVLENGEESQAKVQGNRGMAHKGWVCMVPQRRLRYDKTAPLAAWCTMPVLPPWVSWAIVSRRHCWG